MARYIAAWDLTPLLQAARRWIDTCLIDDGSLFAPGRSLWTSDGADALQRAFVERPDDGDDDFMTKLERQMADAGAPAQQLMAELLWALLLFPSNISAEVKRAHVARAWSWSATARCAKRSPRGIRTSSSPACRRSPGTSTT